MALFWICRPFVGVMPAKFVMGEGTYFVGVQEGCIPEEFEGKLSGVSSPNSGRRQTFETGVS